MAEREHRGEWVPAFEGQRPPFEPGHTASMTHGAYATIALKPRADELAQMIRVLMGDNYGEPHEMAIAAAAMAAARLERVEAARESATDDELGRRLDQDERSWSKLFLAYLSALGLTPASAARIGLERRAKGDGLREHLEAHYREESETP